MTDLLSAQLLEHQQRCNRIDPGVEPYNITTSNAPNRWSKIIETAAADLQSSGSTQDDVEIQQEATELVQQIRELNVELALDLPLRPFDDDGGSDVEVYNAELAYRRPTWRNGPWLLIECYLYRRLQSILLRSRHFRAYDLFKHQKMDTLVSSHDAVRNLSRHYAIIKKSAEHELAKRSKLLWVNLEANMTPEDLEKKQNLKAIRESRSKIVIDDLEKVWDKIKTLKDGRVAIILDNAGFELFADFILVSYLIQFGFVKTVHLYPKDFPWFVSDVTAQDIYLLFEHVKNIPDAQYLVRDWQSWVEQGQIIIHSQSFWTLPVSFWSMKTAAPNLFAELQSCDLVILKGDLNYRKLTADVQWPRTTPFSTAIGPLGLWSGISLLALRTCKADVCVGFDDPMLVEKLDRETKGEWVLKGEYALVSFYDGKRS